MKTDFGGFTPLIDSLVQEIGLMPALVFGVVWRFCQMGEAEACYASLDTIAERVGISYKSAQRHVRALCDAGYLFDATPDLRNRPHTYRDTGKASMCVTVQAVGQSDLPGRSESPSTRPESPSRSVRESERVGQRVLPCSVRESDEDTIQDTIEETSEDTTTTRPPVAAAISLWEAAAGRLISPVEAREILADAEDYSADQIAYAIREAARQNVLKWAYVQGVLRGGCKGLGRERSRASPPPPVKALEGGAVILPYMGGSGSDNARRR